MKPSVFPQRQSDAVTANSSVEIQIGAGIDFADPNSPLAPLYMTTSQVVALGIIAVVIVFLNFVPLKQTDCWGHLAFGRWVWEHGQLPQGNPFRPATAADVPSNYYSWLSQTLYYGVYHVGEVLAGGDELRQMEGGVALLRFVHALLVAIRLAVLLLAFWRLTGSFRLGLFGMLLTFTINLLGHLVIFRPQVAGELCFALLLLAVSRSPLSRLAVVLAPLVLALWANLHGSFAMGFLVLGICLAGKVIEAAWRQRTWRLWRTGADVAVRRLAIALGASLIAVALLNPAGPGIFAQTLGMARHPAVLAMDEWKPIQLQGGPGGQYAYLITLGLLAASLLRARGRISPTAAILTIALGVQPLWHQRALIWWYTALPLIVLPLWLRDKRGTTTPWTVSHSGANFRKTMLAAAIVVVALLWSNPILWLIDGQPAPLERSVSAGTAWPLAFQLQGVGRDDKPWLPELDQWLQTHYPEGKFRGMIFTSETAGDYLVWALPRNMPVFAYCHVHLFTPEHWQLVKIVRAGAPAWRQVLDRNKINMVVVEPDTNRRLRDLLYQDPDWQILHDETDDPGVVDPRTWLLIAVRKTPLR